MGTDRPTEQARNFTFSPDMDDHRKPWTEGPPPAKVTRSAIDQAVLLLKSYLAQHGDWDEVTITGGIVGSVGDMQKWRFTLCECPICQEAVKLVGHPETPHG